MSRAVLSRTVLSRTVVAAVALICAAASAYGQDKAAATSTEPQWLTLPATPTLPEATRSGYAPVNGITISYAVFCLKKKTIQQQRRLDAPNTRVNEGRGVPIRS